MIDLIEICLNPKYETGPFCYKEITEKILIFTAFSIAKTERYSHVFSILLISRTKFNRFCSGWFQSLERVLGYELS